MNNLQIQIKNHLECDLQKRLDKKTLKAYKIDLKQFSAQISVKEIEKITTKILENYIANFHLKYKPKTEKLLL